MERTGVARTKPRADGPARGHAMRKGFGGVSHLRIRRIWPALVVLAGCAAPAAAPPPPPEPILEGPSIREGAFTSEEARITARLVGEAESLFAAGRLTEVRDLAEEVETASAFPLTEDRMKCSYCPYRSYCNRGVHAGDSLDVELETEAEELFNINFEQIGEIAF